MSEAKDRAAPMRGYINSQTGTITFRKLGEPDEVVEYGSFGDDILIRLAAEGYIRLRCAGVTHADLLAGKGFPTRVLPKDKEAATERPLNQYQRAIVEVKTEDMLKARKSGGDKVTPALRVECNVAAVSWVRGLTKEQVDKLKKSAAVRAAYGKITGNDESLDDLLADAAPAADEPVMQEAAE